MSRIVSHCEYCGDEIPAVRAYHGDVIVCGKRECARYETEVYRERQTEARERAEADNYDLYR